MMTQEGVLLLTDAERVALREMARYIRDIEKWRWKADPNNIGAVVALTTWFVMTLVWWDTLWDYLRRSLNSETPYYVMMILSLMSLLTIAVWWFICTSVLYFGFSRRWTMRAKVALDNQQQTLEGRIGIAKLKAFVRVADHFREFGNEVAVKKLLRERI